MAMARGGCKSNDGLAQHSIRLISNLDSVRIDTLRVPVLLLFVGSRLTC
jgi:hypothetical protein